MVAEINRNDCTPIEFGLLRVMQSHQAGGGEMQRVAQTIQKLPLPTPPTAGDKSFGFCYDTCLVSLKWVSYITGAFTGPTQQCAHLRNGTHRMQRPAPTNSQQPPGRPCAPRGSIQLKRLFCRAGPRTVTSRIDID